ERARNTNARLRCARLCIGPAEGLLQIESRGFKRGANIPPIVLGRGLVNRFLVRRFGNTIDDGGTLLDQVAGGCDAGFSFPYIFVEAAAAAERKLAAIHFKALDAAIHLACPAC